MTYVCDSNLGLSGCLHEGTMAELSGHVHSLIFTDHSLILQVTFVAYQNHRNVICVLHP